MDSCTCVHAPHEDAATDMPVFSRSAVHACRGDHKKFWPSLRLHFIPHSSTTMQQMRVGASARGCSSFPPSGAPPAPPPVPTH
mmetsp:Transcript_31639/g.87113  ORF Transcript_31639/g.87113 Transcript_31639/m.87113 type:complete len:83 (-) Transcript_31639:316-564(-)